jgi:hypothetical protein
MRRILSFRLRCTQSLNYKQFLQELVMNWYKFNQKSLSSSMLKALTLVALVGFQASANACPYDESDPRSTFMLGKAYAKNWPQTGSGAECALSYLSPAVVDILGMANPDARKCMKTGYKDLNEVGRKTTNAQMAVWLKSFKENLRQGKFQYLPDQPPLQLQVKTPSSPRPEADAWPSQCLGARDAALRSVDEALADLAKQK